MRYGDRFGDEQLRRVNSYVDLSVLFDSSLTFHPHIDGFISWAKRALGFVIRTTKDFYDIDVIKILYASLIVSRLGYASTVWNPGFQYQPKRIESIHRLYSLHERRFLNDVMFLIKLLQGLVDCGYLLSRLNFRVPAVYSRSRKLFHLPLSRYVLRRHSPLYRMVDSTDEFIENCPPVDLFGDSVFALVSKLKEFLLNLRS